MTYWCLYRVAPMTIACLSDKDHGKQRDHYFMDFSYYQVNVFNYMVLLLETCYHIWILLLFAFVFPGQGSGHGKSEWKLTTLRHRAELPLHLGVSGVTPNPRLCARFWVSAVVMVLSETPKGLFFLMRFVSVPPLACASRNCFAECAVVPVHNIMFTCVVYCCTCT